MGDDVSLISIHPFFRRFVSSILQTVAERDFVREEKVVVDADLVPKVLESTARMIPSVVVVSAKKPVFRERVVPRRVAPVIPAQPRVVVPPVQVREKVTVVPSVGGHVVYGEKEYGKISPILNDASVSTIECLGKGKELMIIRAGQKQRTRIVLDAKEIRAVLDRVADEAHIPLLEGVFRASVKGFSISAVLSELVGSRFVIKKSTAYRLLE